MSENKCCYWVQGLLIGGLVGVVAGMLLAPKSGRETREELSEKAKEITSQLKEEYGAALENSKIAYDTLLVRLRELEARAEKKVKDLKE